MSTLRIESLTIGDELLDGRILDGNTRDLGDTLSIFGLELSGARTVPDNREIIVRALQEACSRADVVVTSGGLGPTSDDITGECIAQLACKGEMRFDDEAYARMVEMFNKRSIPMPESNRRQAVLPATSRTLLNAMGTAPGFVTPVEVALPVVEGGQLRMHTKTVQVWSFPGVPREYHHLRDTFLVPWLSAHLDDNKPRVLVRRTLRSLGAAESAIGEKLGPFEKAHPDVRVQYRAAFPEIIIRLVLEADADADRTALEARADVLAAEAAAAIGKSVYGHGDDPLEVRVLDVARAASLTIGTAESCTGGLIAKRLTDVPGSSDVVVGGVVSYANSAKIGVLDVPAALIEAHGAVSSQVAEAMAIGARARLGVDVAVSVTGVAGPGGGTPDKPVGTVWFGLATPAGVTSVHKKLPDFGRDRVRESTAATALRLVLEALTATELPTQTTTHTTSMTETP